MPTKTLFAMTSHQIRTSWNRLGWTMKSYIGLEIKPRKKILSMLDLFIIQKLVISFHPRVKLLLQSLSFGYR